MHATATILLAHGSRDPHWLAPFQTLCSSVQQQAPQRRIELAFMELAEPSLEQQVLLLAAEGMTNIQILPLFFAAGRHLRVDVPKQLAALSAQLQADGHTVRLDLLEPVGLAAEVIAGISAVILR